MSLTVTISTPCSGSQTLTQATPGLYTGTSGSFSFVVLATDPNQGWLLTVYDTGNPGSSCFPQTIYGQVTPNTSDPKGSYGKMVGTSPDTTAGSASVT